MTASVSITAREISERKRWERHQQLLIAELNHRVKNTLAVVQSLAHQTFTADKPPKQAIAAYEGRLRALASAHNLLTKTNWEAAPLRDVVEGALLEHPVATIAQAAERMVGAPRRNRIGLAAALLQITSTAQSRLPTMPDGWAVAAVLRSEMSASPAPRSRTV